MKAMRVAVAMVGTCLVIGSVSACGGSTPGDPSPQNPASRTTTANQGQPSSPSSTSAQGNTLELMRPCDLLSSQEQQKLGLTGAGTPGNTRTSRGCSWSYGTASIGVSIRAHQGINTFRLSKNQGGKVVSSLKINGRDAKQQSSTDGGCAVTVSVTNTSRVDVTVVGLDPSKSCAAARQVAQVVEPHLPSEKR